MLEVVKETLIDSFKLLPFLFIVYVIMELIEHKASSKTEKIIKKSGKFGPLLGGILGAFPQCGFSVMASNLYLARVITIGTLVAIFLSTSDEMLPVFLANGVGIYKIIKFVLIKVVIGIRFGFIIDLFIFRKKTTTKKEINKMCEHEHCHCDENIIISSLKHTFSIFFFIVMVNFILNTTIYLIGEETLTTLFAKNKILGPMVSGLIGLIPNCAASVVITELFINSALSFGSAIAGLLSSSGVGILILFKLNKDYKENFKILGLTYFISVIIGIIFNILNLTI